MRPHLGSRTNHFVHEFYHFARSPYDMVGHDNAARYVRRYDITLADSSESSSSEDSDAIVEVDIQGNRVSSTYSREYQRVSAAPDSVEREEILTQEGSVLISSDESSSNETPQQSNLFFQGPVLHPVLDETNNTEPNVSSAITMTQLLGRARNFLSSVNEGASTSLAEDSAATSSYTKNTLKREVPSDSEDSDACMIIEEVRKRQPTPEIITLESEEEKTFWPSSSKDKCAKNDVHNTTQDRGGPSYSQSHQEKKGKKKPCLNRRNFPISLGHTKADDSSKQLRKDHSYCSEREVEVFSCQMGEEPDQLSSSEVHQHAKPLQTYKDKHRCLIISSDSEVNFQMQQRKKIKHIEKKYKTRKTMNAPKYEALNQDGCSSGSWLEGNSPARKPRKDHKSKVKNSSHSLNQVSCLQKHNYDQYHCVSETSSNSWCNSDIIGTSSSSIVESSSRDGNWQDGSFSEYSSNPRNFHKKERKDKHGSSKSKYLRRKRKHKKKDKHKDKSKKEKKRRHKKKFKSRKIVSSSSSDSGSSSESSDSRINKHRKIKNRCEDSSSLTSTYQSHKSKARKLRHIEYCSSE